MSKVTFGAATSFEGKDAVTLFQAVALKHGLSLYRKTGIKPNRLWTPTRMLATASGITGKPYKRGQYEQAERDLTAWIAAMQCAMPVEHGDRP